MSIETIEMKDGVLTFHREGRKLIKASFQTRKVQERLSEWDRDVQMGILRKCRHCGTWLERDVRGVWRDFADHFLCADSSSSMHAPVDAD